MHEALMDCPGVIRFEGSFKTSPTHYALVLPLYECSLEAWLRLRWQRSLSSLIDRADRPKMLHWAAQRAKVAQGLLTALVAMHRLQVHHRDIKPANILLSIPNGLHNEQADIKRAVVTDLGFTCVAGTDTDVWPGTTRYMAPELFRKQQYGLAVDIWAAGGTLLELWSGEPLWGWVEDNEIEEMVTQNPGVLWEGVRGRWGGADKLLAKLPSLHSALRQCWAEKPENRPRAHLLERECLAAHAKVTKRGWR